MRWRYLPIPKLQRLHRWSLEVDTWFLPTFYMTCDYVSLIHVIKKRTEGFQLLKDRWWCCFQATTMAEALTGCGSTKGCFMDPSGCSAASCDYVVTYNGTADYVDFEMSVRIPVGLGSSFYAAVGLSRDMLMVGTAGPCRTYLRCNKVIITFKLRRVVVFT